MNRFLEDAGTLGKDIGIVFLAILTYGAFFSLIGAWVKHPVLVGLVYAFGWEGIVSYVPGFTRKLTITHYIQSISPHADTAGAIAMMIGAVALGLVFLAVGNNLSTTEITLRALIAIVAMPFPA